MTLPPESDRAVGMEVYASETPPCRARVRSGVEDFRVEEVLNEIEVGEEARADLLPLYRVEKRLVNTFHVQRMMSEALKSRVTYAGIKDKRAEAVQFMTPTSLRSERPPVVEASGFRATLVGYVSRPLSRSMVSRNRFQIVLRDCCPKIESSVARVFALASELRLPNFYGIQRFGAGDPLTHLVGRRLVMGRFREAVEVLLCRPRSGDTSATVEARSLMAEGRYEEGCGLLPSGQDVEKIVARYLARRPADFLGALRSIPIALRRLYTQAYQSYLFNRTLSQALRRGFDIARAERGDNWGEVAKDSLNIERVHGTNESISANAVPLIQKVGYSYRNYGSRFDGCLEEVLQAEGVAPRDFYQKEMQEVSVEGGFRRPHLVVVEPSSRLSESSAVLAFSLPRGGYATVLLREITKSSDE